MDQFFTWAFLATFVGAVAGTGLITQFIKGAFVKLPTQILSYIVALVILAAATAATSGSSGWTVWLLIPFNAVLVSIASNGAYAGIQRIAGKS